MGGRSGLVASVSTVERVGGVVGFALSWFSLPLQLNMASARGPRSRGRGRGRGWASGPVPASDLHGTPV